MNNNYDFIIIGAGISGCTVATFLNKKFSNASILLVEHGRRIGGRATTRKSRKNLILQFNHGLPSITFRKHISQDIFSIISPLISSRKLLDISNDILLINEFGEINNFSSNYKTYRSLPFMINFCDEIINQSGNKKKIDFLFQTLTKSIKRINNLWEIKINNEGVIQSKNLIISSSLIAHPRCLDILQINSLPLRDAMIKGEDEIIDGVLTHLEKQNYIKRKIYIFHVLNFEVVRNFNQAYYQINFSKVIKENLNFERIIFQRQSDGSMIITLHCLHVDYLIDLSLEEIVKSLQSIFIDHKIFLDLFSQVRLIDKMFWRASQPLDHLLSRELQWSSKSRIGFCGDWFDFNTCGGVETAMSSAIRLSKLINLK